MVIPLLANQVVTPMLSGKQFETFCAKTNKRGVLIETEGLEKFSKLISGGSILDLWSKEFKFRVSIEAWKLYLSRNLGKSRISIHSAANDCIRFLIQNNLNSPYETIHLKI